MRLFPPAGEDFPPAEVVLLELAELEEFIHRVRALVDAHERRINDALSYLPHERRELPPVVPVEYFE